MNQRHLRPVLVSLAALVVSVGLSAAAPVADARTSATSGWKIVASPAIAGGELLGVAALSASDAWAVGTRAANGVFSPLALHWNGTNWTAAPISAPGTFNELFAVTMVSSSDVWAVGVSANWSGLIEHWDGSSWKVVPSPVTGPQTPLYGVAGFASNNVWAVGQNGTRGMILHNDGSTWSPAPHPEPAGSTYTAFSKVAGTSPSDVWAVGESQTASQQPLVEHFNGTSWKFVASAQQGSYNYVRGISVRTTGDAWFVGDWQDAAPAYTEHPLVQRWNGTSWTAVSSQSSEPWAVAALSASDAWIVGNTGSASSSYTAMIEQWNGTSWDPVQGPDLGSGDSELNGLAAVGTTLVAVGSYSPKGTDQPLIEINPAG